MAKQMIDARSVTKAKIFLVDDHPLILAGTSAVINCEPDLGVCGQATDINGALQGINRTRPALAIIDLSLGTASGIELIKDLREQHPRLAILVLTMNDEVIHAHRAIHAGARSYMTKQDGTRNLVVAIRRTLNGRRYLTESIAGKFAEMLIDGQIDSAPIEQLSDRELEIFELLARGCEIGNIAESLHLGISTVHTYCDRMKQKLGVQTERELLVQAVRWKAQRECA